MKTAKILLIIGILFMLFPIVSATNKNTTNQKMISPLSQFKSGIQTENVHCKTGLQLAIKSSSGNPICVKQSSIPRLIGYNVIRNNFLQDTAFSNQQRTQILSLAFDSNDLKKISESGWELVSANYRFPIEPPFGDSFVDITLHLPNGSGNPSKECRTGWWSTSSISLQNHMITKSNHPVETRCADNDYNETNEIPVNITR